MLDEDLKEIAKNAKKDLKKALKDNKGLKYKHYGEFRKHCNRLFSYFNKQSGYNYLVIISDRNVGKTYDIAETFLKNNSKCHDNIIYYFRLTDDQKDKLLANNAEKMFDAPLVEKYFTNRNLVLRTHADSVYAHKMYKVKKGKNKGKIQVSTKPEYKVAEVGALSTFYANKGIASYNFKFLKENPKHNYSFIIDEFQKEKGERKQGDTARQFVNAIHNKIRAEYKRIRCVLLCNDLQEANEILAKCFNFIPIKYGLYKLKSKRCIIDYWQPTETYKKFMSQSSTGLIASKSDANFIDNFKKDLSLITKERRIRPSYIIRFGKTDSDCYIVWDDRIISKFVPKVRKKVKTKDGIKKTIEIANKLPDIKNIPMVRFTEHKFEKEAQKAVFDMYDQRYFLFHSLIDKAQFESDIKLIRSEK